MAKKKTDDKPTLRADGKPRKSLNRHTGNKRKRGRQAVKPNVVKQIVPTVEDLEEAERQRQELSILGYRDNGDALRLVMIQADELLLAGYRLAVGGDNRKTFWAVCDSQGFFSLDGQAVFCLKGNVGKAKLKELVDKGFFDSKRLIRKDKL